MALANARREEAAKAAAAAAAELASKAAAAAARQEQELMLLSKGGAEWSDHKTWRERNEAFLKQYQGQHSPVTENESEGKEVTEECPVCYGDLTLENKIVFPDWTGIRNNGIWCKHSVCRDCYLQHVRSRVLQNKTIIKCPGLCTQGEDHGSPCKWTLEEVHLSLVLVGTRDFAVAVEESALFRQRQRSLARDFKERLKAVSGSVLQGWRTEGLVQVCPKCACLVGRNGGCPHISCDCGYHFCYECGGFLEYGGPPLTASELTRKCTGNCVERDEAREQHWRWQQQQQRLQAELLQVEAEAALIGGLTKPLQSAGVWYEATLAKGRNERRRKHFAKNRGKGSSRPCKRASGSSPSTASSGSKRKARTSKALRRENKGKKEKEKTQGQRRKRNKLGRDVRVY